jgi:hypothetical protein
MELSPDTEQRLAILFAAKDQPAARAILRDQCGDNLAFLQRLGATEIERVRLGALKLSQGRLDKLRQAVHLAQQDFRDLLMAAGFGHDTKAHLAWMPDPPGLSGQ